MKALIAGLAGLFIGGTLAVVAYIELSARRGVPAGPPWEEPYPGWQRGLAELRARAAAAGNRGVDAMSDDWATDPRTAELATGGGR